MTDETRECGCKARCARCEKRDEFAAAQKRAVAAWHRHMQRSKTMPEVARGMQREIGGGIACVMGNAGRRAEKAMLENDDPALIAIGRELRLVAMQMEMWMALMDANLTALELGKETQDAKHSC